MDVDFLRILESRKDSDFVVTSSKPDRVYSSDDIDKISMFYRSKLQEKGFFPFDESNFNKLASFLAYTYTGVGRKGLLLLGSTGSGKSTFLRAVSKLLSIDYLTAIQISEYKELDNNSFGSTSFFDSLKGFSSPLTSRTPCPNYLIIDDLSSEKMIYHYGDKEESLASALTYRYDQFVRYGRKTLISSNLSLSAIGERYGNRVLSRLNEMCTTIELKSQDKRTSFIPVSSQSFKSLA